MSTGSRWWDWKLICDVELLMMNELVIEAMVCGIVCGDSQWLWLWVFGCEQPWLR